MSALKLPQLASPRDDAVQLHKAFKGFGCDSGEVIKILAHRDATQRDLIKQEYRALYLEDLLKRLANELSGKLENAVLLWIEDPASRDAVVLRKALTNVDATALTEVLCSRTPSQIQTFKHIYLQRFGSYLEHDMEKHTSGDHKKLLLAWVSLHRYEGMEVDPRIAEDDAKTLYRAGEMRLGTDETVFIRIFCERSRAHLAAISSCCEHMYGQSLEKAIKKETDGLFKYGLLTIARCAESPAKYFAKVKSLFNHYEPEYNMILVSQMLILEIES